MINPVAWLRRQYIRRIVAARLSKGSYRFRGAQGEILAHGRIRSRWFSFELLPCRVMRSGIVKRMELLTAEHHVAIDYPSPRAFTISKRKAFAGKHIAFP